MSASTVCLREEGRDMRKSVGFICVWGPSAAVEGDPLSTLSCKRAIEELEFKDNCVELSDQTF